MHPGKKTVLRVAAVVLAILSAAVAFRGLGRVFAPQHKKVFADTSQPSYMIYYGALNDALIEQAKQYDIVILHPRGGDLTRKQVREIQSAGTLVFGYLSIGEDLRTGGISPEQMLWDERFIGDGSGPRVDPREPGSAALEQEGYLGSPSPAGAGYASYYLDDKDHDGKPDFNPNSDFACAYVNIGDPAWYDALRGMLLDEADGVAGIREILTVNYGRSLGCDGVFLDTIDVCAPNSYTDDSFEGRTRYEWIAPGVAQFMARLKEDFPDKLIIQNRGLFFYNHELPQFDYSPRQYVDFVLFESYMLDSSSSQLYSDLNFSVNKNTYTPKLLAEAGRPDGFRILSLGYAEGPEQYHLKEALAGEPGSGLDILLKDLEETRDTAGFSHYITDAGVTMANNFVLEHPPGEDTTPPAWSSVHHSDMRSPPAPKVGIGYAESDGAGGILVQWDVAIDPSGVKYTLYYQQEPFDFGADPNLENAQKLELSPDIGSGYSYDAGPNTWPYQQRITGLKSGKEYHFVIRASDRSPAGNEEKNTVSISATPERTARALGAGDGLRLFMIAAGLVILVMTILSLARRHMTETFCIAWSILAAMLICGGIVLRPTMWSSFISWHGLLMILFGSVLALACAFFISTRLCQLTRQVKELAIQVSLLNQENDELRRRSGELEENGDEDREEAFVCN